MSNTQILWNPSKSNLFSLLSGDQLSLYHVENSANASPNGRSIFLSPNTHADLIASTTTSNFVRCVSWCPRTDFGHLLATGSTTGSATIMGFPDDPLAGRHGSLSLQNREFPARHSRPCTAIAWNPSDVRFIAVGLERIRADPGLVVYDIFSSSSKSISTTASAKGEHDVRGTVELLSNDGVASIAWYQQNPNTMLVGLSLSGLRILDLRDPVKPSRSYNTRCVQGVCIDPFGENRMASFGEHTIMVWDLRRQDLPIAQHDTKRNVTEMTWCPTRYGLLGMVLRDSSDFHLLDVQHAHMTQDDYDPVILQRTVGLPDGKALSSFSWHPSDENRALVVSHYPFIQEIRVRERMTLNWSKTHHLLWAAGREIHSLSNKEAPEPVIKAINEDISVVMKARGMSDYGMKTNCFTDNIPLLFGQQEPLAMWWWLERVRAVEGMDRLDGLSFKGLKTILYGQKKVDIVAGSFQGTSRKDVMQYSSTERSNVLRLCGWDLNISATIDAAIARKHYERAAALAVFNLTLAHAISILQKASDGSSQQYTLAAVALSAFSDGAKGLPSVWQQTPSEITKNLHGVYLRVIFSFLLSDQPEECLRKMVRDPDLLLEDRIALACAFLSDAKMLEFVNELTVDMMSKGRLEGLILTGFSREGIDLVQRYVDLTGDVQTASLLSSIITTREWAEDARPHDWVDNYKDVLDSWMLWGARATFDVFYNQLRGGGPRVQRQVMASCTYCGKAVHHMPGMFSVSGRGEKLLSAKTANVGEISKMTACSSCGKPLPKCAICQINVGTPTNMGYVTGEPDDASVKKATKINPVEKWFVWCQSCRHGGHAAHIAEWFRDHQECPVTGCLCKCVSIENGCATVANNRRRLATSN